MNFFQFQKYKVWPIAALSVFLFLSGVGSLAQISKGEEVLLEMQRDFKKIDVRNSVIPMIDARRLIDPYNWEEALIRGESPWLVYGEETYKSWARGVEFIRSKVRGRKFDLTLYNQLERVVMQGHYYHGFEIRRIQAAVQNGEITQKKAERLLKKIENGEKVYFSDVDHSKLPARFRWDPLDEFRHNGDSFYRGERYLTTEEIEAARENPLFRVEEKSLKSIGNGRYRGTIHYPHIADLKRLVEDSFEVVNTEIKEASSLESKVKAILKFRQKLMTIHRSLDGNGRTIRLLTDLLFLRTGLPPPALPDVYDLFASNEEVYKRNIEAMREYLSSVRSYQLKPSVPKVLFHWSTQGSLHWMLDQRKRGNKVPMQTIDPSSALAVHHSQLSQKMGTHTWVNAVTAMRGGQDSTGIEWYVKPEKSPVLVAYFITEEARIQTVRTFGLLEEERRSAKNFKGADLIYHQHFDHRNQLVFHEWVILNPKVVRSWSIDPKDLDSYLRPELEKDRRLKSAYPEQERHFPDRDNSQRSILKENRILRQILATPKAVVCEMAIRSL